MAIYTPEQSPNQGRGISPTYADAATDMTFQEANGRGMILLRAKAAIAGAVQIDIDGVKGIDGRTETVSKTLTVAGDSEVLGPLDPALWAKNGAITAAVASGIATDVEVAYINLPIV